MNVIRSYTVAVDPTRLFYCSFFSYIFQLSTFFFSFKVDTMSMYISLRGRGCVLRFQTPHSILLNEGVLFTCDNTGVYSCPVFPCRCVNWDCLNFRRVFSVRSFSGENGVRNELSIGLMISDFLTGHFITFLL